METTVRSMGHPAEGTWILDTMFVGPELGDFPLESKMGGKKISMEVSNLHGESYRFTAKVVNVLMFDATPVLNHIGEAPFAGLKIEGSGSTLMMGPPEMMETENAFSTSLSGANKWLVRENTMLISGPTAELRFSRSSD